MPPPQPGRGNVLTGVCLSACQQDNSKILRADFHDIPEVGKLRTAKSGLKFGRLEDCVTTTSV